MTDRFPEETNYTLSKIITVDDVQNLNMVLEGSPEVKSSRHTHPLCLEAGYYEFVIRNSKEDGICCEYGTGYYSVMVDGAVVAKGGEFSSKFETITFAVGIAPSIQPSTLSSPSTSSHPSFRPSVSHQPSEIPSLIY